MDRWIWIDENRSMHDAGTSETSGALSFNTAKSTYRFFRYFQESSKPLLISSKFLSMILLKPKSRESFSARKNTIVTVVPFIPFKRRAHIWRRLKSCLFWIRLDIQTTRCLLPRLYELRVDLQRRLRRHSTSYGLRSHSSGRLRLRCHNAARQDANLKCNVVLSC